MNITQTIAAELNATAAQVEAAVALLDEGSTVPFIARYRKEATGGLDDSQLRTLAERLQYLRELADRKATVLKSIEEQGKLSDELKAQIEAADNKTTLEDLYLPYKPKRRTKAQIARENGLQPLAELLLNTPSENPETAAQGYLNENVADTRAALDGARAILMEQFAEDAELIGRLREKLWREAEIHAQVMAGQEAAGEKFKDYFDHREPVRTICGFASGLSHLLMATIIGTFAALAWLIASMVCGITASSAATTSTTISVTCAPRARIEVKAAWPGVSRKVTSAPLGVFT